MLTTDSAPCPRPRTIASVMKSVVALLARLIAKTAPANPTATAVSTLCARPLIRARHALASSSVSAFGRMRRPTATTVSAAST